MTVVKIFDPAMCCSTGVCGPSVDPELARFAGDLEWLAARGVVVERYNLTQQPEAFVAHPTVAEALEAGGEASLPVILVDGRKVSEGVYPTREHLGTWARLGAPGASPLRVLSTPGGSCGCGPAGCC